MAWLFPSVIIEGCGEEEAKAVYARAMQSLERDLRYFSACVGIDVEVRWDEGCEKIEDAEVVA